MSADGKQLAYLTHNCGADGCTYAVDCRTSAARRHAPILDGATAGYGLEWSPDRRNLIFVGTWQGAVGLLPRSRRWAARRAT